jgi:lambda repressor-like predicted transcriptional regulator
MNEDDLHARIADLEAAVRDKSDRLQWALNGLDEAHELVAKMREHVEDANAMIDSWIEVFDMKMDEDGTWRWDDSDAWQWEYAAKLSETHRKLMRDWNKFVPVYNATISPRYFGRRLEASDAQVDEVRRLRKKGMSLRGIAEATSLSLRTVRTITDRGTDKERTRTNELRREHYDKIGAARFKAQKRGRDELPKRINRLLKDGEELMKAAKGLGKR